MTLEEKITFYSREDAAEFQKYLKEKDCSARISVEHTFSGTPYSEGTIAADNNQGVNALFFEHFGCQSTTFRRAETLTSCSTKDSTAALNDARHVLGGELLHLAVDQAVIAVIYSLYFDPIANSSTRDGADGCVHTGGMTSTGKDTYAFILHNSEY